MDDKEQDAVDALRTAGLEAEAEAVEKLRARHLGVMDAYHAGQRESHKSGQESERETWRAIAYRVAADANRYGLEGLRVRCTISETGAIVSWEMDRA